MSYYLAPSLKQLRDEINDAHPGRDKASDGWIGDPSHRARKSDHNPDYEDGGVVRALDIDISDIDEDELMRVLKGDKRTNYYIFERSIYGASRFERRAYKGVNPHNKHLHVSIKHTKAAEAGHAWGYGDKIKPTGSKAKPKPIHSSQPTDYKNLATDGIFGKKSIEALQIVMRATGDYPGIVDGKAGPLTWKAVQSWLKGHGLYTRAIDGKPGYYTIYALQQFLRSKKLYPASKWRLDGDFGPATVEAFQAYLNTQNGQ